MFFYGVTFPILSLSVKLCHWVQNKWTVYIESFKKIYLANHDFLISMIRVFINKGIFVIVNV